MKLISFEESSNEGSAEPATEILISFATSNEGSAEPATEPATEILILFEESRPVRSSDWSASQ